MHFRSAAALAVLCLASCLENEEEIVVRADGSVAVNVKAHGDFSDLTSGYAVPLGGPWVPGGGDTMAWLNHVGPDTGSDAVRRNAGQVDWLATGADDPEKASIEASTEFRSVADWPRWYAPASDPYRTAYLERSATLKVEDKGKVTVYTFERVYHGRRHDGYDPDEMLRKRIPEEVWERLDKAEPIAFEVWDQQVNTHVLSAHQDALERHFRDATLLVYTEGDASLDPAVIDQVMADVRAAVTEYITPEATFAWYEDIRRRKLLKEQGVEVDDDGPHPMEQTESKLEDALRNITASLAGKGVAQETVNAVLYGLEWGSTAHGHTADLGDEKFHVKITMPGTIVGGTFAEKHGATASWHYEGGDLHDRDLVMRVVSVLEK